MGEGTVRLVSAVGWRVTGVCGGITGDVYVFCARARLP